MSSSSSTFSTSSATTDGDFLVKSQFTTTHHSITSEKLHGKNYTSWSTAVKQSETDNATHMGRFQSFVTEFRDLLPFTSDARAYAKKMDELLVIMYLHTIRPDLDSVKSFILGSPAIPSLTEKSRSALLFSLHQLAMAEGDPLLPVEEEHLAQAETGNPTRAVDMGARNLSIVTNLALEGHLL
ncbi:hypothetical protein AKJ16_DCAP26082 [Drosera capensis]